MVLELCLIYSHICILSTFWLTFLSSTVLYIIWARSKVWLHKTQTLWTIREQQTWQKHLEDIWKGINVAIICGENRVESWLMLLLELTKQNSQLVCPLWTRSWTTWFIILCCWLSYLRGTTNLPKDFLKWSLRFCGLNSTNIVSVTLGIWRGLLLNSSSSPPYNMGMSGLSWQAKGASKGRSAIPLQCCSETKNCYHKRKSISCTELRKSWCLDHVVKISVYSAQCIDYRDLHRLEDWVEWE